MARALISGAGIGGLTAALALAQNGHEVEVFERTPVLAEVGAGLQLSPNAMHVLANLGLSEPLQKHAFEPENAVMRHHKTARPYFQIPLRAAMRARYGAPYLNILRSDLHEALITATGALGIPIHLGQTVETYQQSPTSVSIIGAEGDLLIGADGLRSAIRTQMLGPDTPRFTGQVAWRGTLPARALPENTISPDATVWAGPGRHLVTYYVRAARQINFVAVEERATWTDESWTHEGNIDDLRAAFTGWHPSVTALLEAATTARLWALYDRAPLSKWCDNRVTLLGDACHPMLPFMAQGAAMAIEDAAQLAASLKTTSDIPTALRQYEAARKPRTSQIQSMSQANSALYHGPQKPLNRLKLSVAGRIPFLAARALAPVYGYKSPT